MDFRLAAAKKVKTKRFYTPPLGGKKTAGVLFAPQKESFGQQEKKVGKNDSFCETNKTFYPLEGLRVKK